VIEVECLDRPGLLYDMTQALFEAGLSISTSMIATYGERAVDVFYVRDGFGHRIDHPARLDAVEKRLRMALAPPPLEAATPTKA
jgi:[protein-PII] uridylyltransferase